MSYYKTNNNNYNNNENNHNIIFAIEQIIPALNCHNIQMNTLEKNSFDQIQPMKK